MTQTDLPFQPDSAWLFAEHVANTKFEDLPDEAVFVAKCSILDTIGVIVGGVGLMPAVRSMIDLLGEERPAESTILGTTQKVPARTAAFINGLASHLLDYDDMHEIMGTHPSAPIVPAALALGERLGDVDGKTFLTAVVLAQDVYPRLASINLYRFGIHPGLALGGYGAAAACCRILGLSATETHDAFAIVSGRAGGLFQLVVGGSTLRGHANNFTAHDGLLASLMAEKHLAGDEPLFEAESGLFDGDAGLFAVLARNDYDRHAVIGGLGKEYPGAEISFKPWPGCRLAHVYIDALIRLVQENDLHPDDVTHILAHVGRTARTLFEPTSYRPTNDMEAKFSMPYLLSVALTNRTITLDDFTPQALADSGRLALCDRVSYQFDEQYNPVGSHTGAPGRVDVRLRSGKELTYTLDWGCGHPENPLSWESLVAKFRDCVAHSAEPISLERCDEAIEMVLNLEKETSISRLSLQP